jgi:hypothetical protein
VAFGRSIGCEATQSDGEFAVEYKLACLPGLDIRKELALGHGSEGE